MLYSLCVWLHIAAATAWIGAMIFFSVVVVPVLRRPGHRAVAPALIRAFGARFRALGWIALGVLVATGVLNLGFHGIGWLEVTSTSFWASPFGRALGYKLALVALVLLASLGHDVLTGKRALDAVERAPGSTAARRMRRTASWLGRATLLLSLAVLYFAVALVRGMP